MILIPQWRNGRSGALWDILAQKCIRTETVLYTLNKYTANKKYGSISQTACVFVYGGVALQISGPINEMEGWSFKATGERAA